ncbi:MAG TPA: ketoacyl-ACP synthase III [Rhizomicrobium sp.]|nr:ketoacyl-ACP synthase III [Rhizomicrobium sp.]
MQNDTFGVAAIGTYLPVETQGNESLATQFGFADDFLSSKIGVTAPRRKSSSEETSDLCVRAFEDLRNRAGDRLDDVDLIVVVTQNPDGHGLPHTSAIVHQKLDLPKRCFAFDISLGCSGFVAALAITKGYLSATGGRKAILFTADPYSKVLDREDRNTALIFGDGACATLICETPAWRIGAFDFGTDGKKSAALSVTPEAKLVMNGRSVFDFCALNVPGSVERALTANGLTKQDVDGYVLHPGSRYIVDTLHDRLKVPRIPFPAPYGNTVSSSIPMILRNMDPVVQRTVVVSGFGVGLSWATTVLRSVTP